MEKKQTVVKWFKQQLDNLDIEIPQSIFEQALEMENKIKQEYYNEGAQDCKKAFEKIISDVMGNINNI